MSVPYSHSGHRSFGKSLVTAPIRAYQYLTAGRIPSCRYAPTCSSYAIEAIEVHGVMHGMWLALRRLSRCHPWGGHGYDPVPERKVD